MKAICIKPATGANLLNIYEIAFWKKDESYVVVHISDENVRCLSREKFDRHFKILDSDEGRG